MESPYYMSMFVQIMFWNDDSNVVDFLLNSVVRGPLSTMFSLFFSPISNFGKFYDFDILLVYVKLIL